MENREEKRENKVNRQVLRDRTEAETADVSPEVGAEFSKLGGEPTREHPLHAEHGLRHSMGGVTTRDDENDLGVKMLPGDPKERVGPEDALGDGPKRGDYTERIGPRDYHPHVFLPVEDPEPDGPRFKKVVQRPLAEQIGDAKRLKGGVDTQKNSV